MERNYENEGKTSERRLREQSPEEAKQTVKEKVSRGVATVAGALEGFTQQMRQNDVPEKSKEAVEKVGETTRKLSEVTRREGKQVKESVSQSGGPSATGTAHRAPASSAQPEQTSGSSRVQTEDLKRR